MNGHIKRYRQYSIGLNIGHCGFILVEHRCEKGSTLPTGIAFKRSIYAQKIRTVTVRERKFLWGTRQTRNLLIYYYFLG